MQSSWWNLKKNVVDFLDCVNTASLSYFFTHSVEKDKVSVTFVHVQPADFQVFKSRWADRKQARGYVFQIITVPSSQAILLKTE